LPRAACWVILPPGIFTRIEELSLSGLRLDRSGGLARIIIDRPEKSNAMSRALLTELDQRLDEVAADETARVLILTGAGDRAFCAGADLAELRAETADLAAARTFDALWDRVTDKIAQLPLLTLALLNGACAGGGLALALALDLRIAVEGAQIFYPALKNKVLPSPRDLTRLHALIGPSRTKMLLMGGHRLDATEALRWGLVDEVVAVGALKEAAERVSAGALAAEPHEVVAMKRICDRFTDAETVEDCYRAIFAGDVAARASLRKG
jgi:enoyl-CoA hydratase